MVWIDQTVGNVVTNKKNQFYDNIPIKFTEHVVKYIRSIAKAYSVSILTIFYAMNHMLSPFRCATRLIRTIFQINSIRYSIWIFVILRRI